MPQINDEIFRATAGPTVNDGLAKWFGKTATESLQDAERRWLLAFAATSTGANSDLWFEYLRSLGHTGALNDMKLQYWSGQAAGLPIIADLIAAYIKGVGITGAGSGVAVWADSSGNGNDLLQGTDADRPTYDDPNAILTFNGVSQFLKAAPFTLAQPTTVYILAKQLAWSSNGTFFDGNVSNSGRLKQLQPPNEIVMQSPAEGQLSLDLAIGNFGVVACVFDGAASILQVDQNAPILNSTGVSAMGGFTVGASGGLSAFANIEVVEVLIYDAAHTAQEITDIVNYLTPKIP